jgi:leucyl aminopeptidase (aminopeptidase T)
MEDLKPLIEQVFNPKKGENIIILNDFPEDDLEIDNDYIARRHFARQWFHDFLELSKKKGFTVQDMITYEPTKANNSPLPKKANQHGKEIDLHKILKSAGKKDIVIAINRYSATAPLREFMKKSGFRAASMPGVDEDMTGFTADYALVKKKASILAEKMTKAIGANVEFSTGNKIYFDLRKYEGHIDDGIIHEAGKLSNLPAGEAYTCAYEGFDKKLGKSLTKGEIPVYKGEEKITLIVEENKIVEVQGIGKKAEEFRKFLDEEDARKYIAEVGLGCNDKAEFCGKTIQDEKIEGMHFAYGYNGHFGGAIDKKKFSSEDKIVHQDIVYSLASKAHITKFEFVLKDDSKEVIIIDGKYVDGLFD